jgi:hypothetical protein
VVVVVVVTVIEGITHNHVMEDLAVTHHEEEEVAEATGMLCYTYSTYFCT